MHIHTGQVITGYIVKGIIVIGLAIKSVETMVAEQEIQNPKYKDRTRFHCNS